MLEYYLPLHEGGLVLPEEGLYTRETHSLDRPGTEEWIEMDLVRTHRFQAAGAASATRDLIRLTAVSQSRSCIRHRNCGLGLRVYCR